MKRDTALQPLSHQHHNALMGVMLIRKGVKKNADKKILKDFTVNWWQKQLDQHMQTEEKVLLPYLQKHKFNKTYLNVIHRDHETIRLLGDRMKVYEDGYTLFNVYTDIVEQHIRFEERVVFQKIQEDFSSHDLSQIQNQLFETGKQCTEYPVKFWE